MLTARGPLCTKNIGTHVPLPIVLPRRLADRAVGHEPAGEDRGDHAEVGRVPRASERASERADKSATHTQLQK